MIYKNNFTVIIRSIFRVALENCIISDGATIENECNLKGCIVGSHFVITEGSEHTNEVLTESDRLMEF